MTASDVIKPDSINEKNKTFHLAGLVLARGGSKGIPLKNLAEVGGLPLLTWVLRAAKDSEVFDSLWVSTDHERIAKLAETLGANVHQRPPEVSKDSSTSMETAQEFLSHHPEIDAIGLLQATSPCVHPDHLQQGAKLLREQNYDSVFSVVRNHFFRWKETNTSAGEVTVALNFDPSNRVRRQDWKGELCENGAFYFSLVSLIKDGVFQGGKLAYVEMSQEHSMDINTPFDLIVANHVVKKYGYKGKTPLFTSGVMESQVM